MTDLIEELEDKYEDKIVDYKGFRYIVLEEGAGSKPEKGAYVTAHYTGKLVNGTVFDSSVQRNEPFEFEVGMGEVIKGWDLAFLNMNRGEKRILILPPELAYGKDKVGPIPKNSTLIFEVELIDF